MARSFTTKIAGDQIILENNSSLSTQDGGLSVSATGGLKVDFAVVAHKSTVNQNLADEIVARTSAVLAEENARIAGDSVLTSNLAVEISARASAVLAEETARIAGDSVLTSNLNVEISARASAVLAEENARIAGDSVLTSNLAVEVSTRASAVAAEEAARIAGDSVLTSNLAVEVAARSTAVAAEESARIAGDSVLTSNLAKLVNRTKKEYADFEGGLTTEMVEYCQEDVSICGELYHYLTRELKGFSEQSISLEHKVAAIVARQEKHGFKLDTVKSQCLLGQWKRRLSDIEENLQSVFPPIVTERISEKTGKKLKDDVEVFNPGSRQQIAKRLIEQK